MKHSGEHDCWMFWANNKIVYTYYPNLSPNLNLSRLLCYYVFVPNTKNKPFRCFAGQTALLCTRRLPKKIETDSGPVVEIE